MQKESGHRDINGNWVPESPQAKLRNKLTPFWTLSEIISNERYDKSNDELVQLILEIANRCEGIKEEILDLIKQTEE
jgi:hypothetical protein